MKRDTKEDLSNFYVNAGVFCGIDATLINPKPSDLIWTQRNKFYRSSIWSADDLSLLSAGFPKFTNFNENPDNFPVPTSISRSNIIEKIDGSLVCIDYLNDQLSMRSRGTFSYKTLDNNKDFEYCLFMNPKLVKWIENNSNYTVLCEITTPNLKIVLNYGDTPKLWLIGAINKDDYSLMTQLDLDTLAKECDIDRPKRYTFNSILDLLNNVEDWVNLEGVCLYSNNDQIIHKIKSAHYLKLHYLKSEFSDIEKIIDLWLQQNKPSYTDFYNHIKDMFDYELAEQVRGEISKICDAYKEVNNIISNMRGFAKTVSVLSRKNAAEKIISSYGNTNRSGFVFQFLDGKELNNDAIKKLLFQCLKN